MHSQSYTAEFLILRNYSRYGNFFNSRKKTIKLSLKTKIHFAPILQSIRERAAAKTCSSLYTKPPFYTGAKFLSSSGAKLGRNKENKPPAADKNAKVPAVTASSSPPGANESVLNGCNANFIEEMYKKWKEDPKSIDSNKFGLLQGSQTFTATRNQFSSKLSNLQTRVSHLFQTWDALFNDKYLTPVHLKAKLHTPGGQGAISPETSVNAIDEHVSLHNMIKNYQTWGHLLANLDPLELRSTSQRDLNPNDTREQQLSRWIKRDMRDHDKNMEKEYRLPPSTFVGAEKKSLPLKDIIARLQQAYCSNIGVEFMTVNSFEKRKWIRQKFETPGCINFSADDKRLIMGRLTRATGFENFLNKKWPGEKRFGLEGCDMMIPGMKQIIDTSSCLGIESVVIGMAHRGRLNVLSNVCHKPLSQLFTQFTGIATTTEGAGDVKYHLGTYVERRLHTNKKNLRLTVVANPSHLEAVNPITQGKVHAEQFYRGDFDGKKVMSILIHGDASMSGQGIVFETMNLSELPEYTTHGTIHIVVNNQIGFTTDPRISRSSTYCTDVAHVVNAPIFHVNVDDPESVVYVCKVAAEWRAKFHKDVVIDIVGYRRFGHNEMDEPMFTQPLMYKKIKTIKPCQLKYAEKLISEKVMTKEQIKAIEDDYDKLCEEGFQKAKKETHINLNDWLDSPWPGFFGKGKERENLHVCPTGVDMKSLIHIATMYSSLPPSAVPFEVHKGIERVLAARMEMVNAKTADWAIGETLAYGTLLRDGVHVRLSGEDVERGTFSHRHHVLHHQTIDKATYKPLNHLYPDQAPYSVCNSSLSENAILGFEVGYSMTNPNALVIWEAQFGDFSNNGQVVIDQFIASGESKWVRQCGIVLLQPHGMEGMGPEHSSARLERYLQLTSEDGDQFPNYKENFELNQLYDINWIIANITTPANLFHILRRQIALPFRKPLVIMSPKSLLRHPEAKSSFAEMDCSTVFQRVIPDNGPASKKPNEVKRLIFCTGKVYYDLAKARKTKKLEESIAITRIEQVSPFPFDLVQAEANKYANAQLCWAQEEHKNSGAWTYIQPRMYTATCAKRCVEYCGRAVSASPATGLKTTHAAELEMLLAHAMDTS